MALFFRVDVSPLKGVALIVGLVLSEGILWVGWLALAFATNLVLATAVFTLIMLVEHSSEVALLVSGDRPLAYVFEARTIFFTLVEALGAAAWLYFFRQDQELLGGVILFVALFLEHVIQGFVVLNQREELIAAREGAGAGS